VANLPYNVATPLLIRWLGEAAHFAGLTLMFQDEVAERIAAERRAETLSIAEFDRLARLLWSGTGLPEVDGSEG
jgi:16S rRNA A1518/A1519 N6-dimethyltransferase RsmA/KsgA/DIM1 with predicted DNA glycosylase/AP lyase activity